MFGTVNNEFWTLTILGDRDAEGASKLPGVIEFFIAWKIVYPRRIPTLVLILFQLYIVPFCQSGVDRTPHAESNSNDKMTNTSIEMVE